MNSEITVCKQLNKMHRKPLEVSNISLDHAKGIPTPAIKHMTPDR
jgi:hypothetical protein